MLEGDNPLDMSWNINGFIHSLISELIDALISVLSLVAT